MCVVRFRTSRSVHEKKNVIYIEYVRMQNCHSKIANAIPNMMIYFARHRVAGACAFNFSNFNYSSGCSDISRRTHLKNLPAECRASRKSHTHTWHDMRWGTTNSSNFTLDLPWHARTPRISADLNVLWFSEYFFRHRSFRFHRTES